MINKKILVSLLFASIITVSTSVTAMGLQTINADINNDLILNSVENLDTEGKNITHLLSVSGPLWGFITDVTINDGTSPQVDKINKLVNRNILHYLVPFSFVQVENLNFTVEFKRQTIIDFSRFSYQTFMLDIKNTTGYDAVNYTFSNFSFINTPHTINVKNFDGFFFFTGGKLLRLKPARFSFIGTYEEMMLIA